MEITSVILQSCLCRQHVLIQFWFNKNRFFKKTLSKLQAHLFITSLLLQACRYKKYYNQICCVLGNHAGNHALKCNGVIFVYFYSSRGWGTSEGATKKSDSIRSWPHDGCWGITEQPKWLEYCSALTVKQVINVHLLHLFPQMFME